MGYQVYELQEEGKKKVAFEKAYCNKKYPKKAEEETSNNNINYNNNNTNTINNNNTFIFI